MRNSNSNHFKGPLGILFALWFAAILFFPSLLSGEAVAREALSNFPADTEQLVYSNLAELRTLPNYPRIRERLYTRQLSNFEDFLRSTGADPEKDVSEVALGWRGERLDAAGFFGLAEGRFDGERVRRFFAENQLPTREHAGFELYAFGSGEDSADLYFTFFSSSTAAFGRLSDLKAMIDVHTRAGPALDSKSTFVGWEAELEGSAPQWGIASGKAAARQAAPWLTTGGKASIDPAAFTRPVQTVLYRVTWDSGFSTHLTIVCESSESAAALVQLFTLWRSSQQAQAAGSPPAVADFLRQMDVETNGSRLEMNVSGPIEALDKILPNR